MSGFQVFNAAEQVAKHLKEELLRGTWVGLMPGEDRLMAHLGIGRNTVGQALALLEADGDIESQGPGRRRRIMFSQKHEPAMRVTVILYERD